MLTTKVKITQSEFFYELKRYFRPGGVLPYLGYMGLAAGQGMVFGLAVLNRVYNLTCLCPKQVKNLS